MEKYCIRPIAHVRSDYNEKFGIPKQAGLVDELEQVIVIEPEFRNIDALRGLEEFSRIWIIWGFSGNIVDMEAEPVQWSPLVRPPRLGGKIKKGVWASRSPYRPNSLGMSNVRLVRIEDGDELSIIVAGGDMMDGTPVFDIKPYIPFSDSHPEASQGYSRGTGDATLDVVFPDELLDKISAEKRAGLMRILELDPRGAYEKKDGYIYGLSFSAWDIRFVVEDTILTVVEVVSGAENSGHTK